MAGKQGSFKWKSDTLFANMRLFEPRLDRALVALTEFYGNRIEGAAKMNAPWTDRTGNARGGLETAVTHAPGVHRITLFHKVEYGLWLEIANGGRYRIIMPTLESQGRQMMRDAERLVRRTS